MPHSAAKPRGGSDVAELSAFARAKLATGALDNTPRPICRGFLFANIRFRKVPPSQMGTVRSCTAVVVVLIPPPKERGVRVPASSPCFIGNSEAGENAGPEPISSLKYFTSKPASSLCAPSSSRGIRGVGWNW